jgi:hypothetical protein
MYDRVLTVYSLDTESSPLSRSLVGPGGRYFYEEKEVYASRFYAARQAGEDVHMLVEIPLDPGDARILPEQYCIPADGQVYRIVQAQYGRDQDGLPVTTLSLQRKEGKYAILHPCEHT